MFNTAAIAYYFNFFEKKMKKSTPTISHSSNEERLENNENTVPLNKRISPAIRKIQEGRKKADIIKNDESPSVQLFKKVKILKNPCSIKCAFKCVHKITANQRQQILKYFYGLRSLTLRKLFIQKCVDGGPHDSKYHFTINGNRMQVCKPFYLSTLSVTLSYVNAALVYPGTDVKTQGDSEKSIEKQNEVEEKKKKDEDNQNKAEEQNDNVEEDQNEVEEMENDVTPESTQATNEKGNEGDTAPKNVEHSLEYVRKEEEENEDIRVGMVCHITSIPRVVTCLQTKDGRKYVETYVKATKMYEHYLKHCEENKCKAGGFPLYNKLFLENHQIMLKARKNLPVIEPGDIFILNFDREREPNSENE